MQKRNLALDGLRGLAALSVAIGHCATAMGGAGVLSLTVWNFSHASAHDVGFRILHILFPADAAVIVFFVLSGHVLTASLVSKSGALDQFGPFVWRRIFRLLPVSIAAAIPLALMTSATPHQIFGAALLFDYSANGPIWSLQVEIFGSLLIYLCWALRALSLWLNLAVLAVSAYCALHSNHYIVLFLPAFVFGALIRDCPPAIFRPRIIPAISLLLLVTADALVGPGHAAISIKVVTSFMLVGYVATNKVAILSSEPVEFLGLVSYPFYLLHLSGGTLTYLLLGGVGVSLASINPFEACAVYAAISIPIALYAASIVHRFVEMPGITAGAALARKINEQDQQRVPSPEFPR